MAQEFLFAQSKWRLAAVGSVIVLLVVAIIFMSPSSGGYDRALAEEIAKNSPEVQAALGSEEVIILQVDEEDSIVVCSSEMQPPIAAKGDLKAKVVTAIANVEFPELTEEEKELANEVVKTNEKGFYIFDDNVLSLDVYPAFVAGTVDTDLGEIELLPGPKMVIVKYELVIDPKYNEDNYNRVIHDSHHMKIELDKGPYTVFARVDLDAEKLMGVEAENRRGVDRYGDLGDDPVKKAEWDQAQEQGKVKAIELIEADPTGRTLLAQGFDILKDEILILTDTTYLESDDGIIVTDIPRWTQNVSMKRGDITWDVRIDLVEETVSWWTDNTVYEEYDPELDDAVRESALELLPTFDCTDDLLERGAKPYIIIRSYTKEYSPIPEDGVRLGRYVPWSEIYVYLILGDSMWITNIDIVSGEIFDCNEMPPEHRTSSDEKRIILEIVQSQPEVVEILNRGAEVIFMARYNPDDEDEPETIGAALIYLEETCEAWTARVNLDTKDLMELECDSCEKKSRMK